MNCYAYPIIFEAMKEKVDNFLSVELYDSIIHIYRKNGYIYIQDFEKEIIYELGNFNFYSRKPIEKITIICDKYGGKHSIIFDKQYVKAATIIQRSWKRHRYNSF
jgi:hypothetical protein